MSGRKIGRDGQNEPISGQVLPIDGQEDGQRLRLRAVLKRLAPFKTADTVAASGIAPAATVRKWLALTAFPSGFALIRIGRRYGLAVLCEIMGSDTVTIRVMLDRAERRKALMAEVNALDRLG